MRTFTMFRPNVPDATHNADQKNAPDQPQFQGVVFDDGTVAVRWMTAKRSTSVWASMEDMLAIHGHPEYGSVLRWETEAEVERLKGVLQQIGEGTRDGQHCAEGRARHTGLPRRQPSRLQPYRSCRVEQGCVCRICLGQGSVESHPLDAPTTTTTGGKAMSGTGSSEDNCPYCGAYHVGAACHRLKRIEYNQDGLTIKAVEFHPPNAGSAMDPRKVCASPLPASRVIGKEEW